MKYKFVIFYITNKMGNAVQKGRLHYNQNFDKNSSSVNEHQNYPSNGSKDKFPLEENSSFSSREKDRSLDDPSLLSKDNNPNFSLEKHIGSNISNITSHHHSEIFRCRIDNDGTLSEEGLTTSDLIEKVDTSELDNYVTQMCSTPSETFIALDINVNHSNTNNVRRPSIDLGNLNKSTEIQKTNPIIIPNSNKKDAKHIVQGLIIEDIETEQISCIECRKSILRIKNDYSEEFCSVKCRYNNYYKLEYYTCNYCNNKFVRNKRDKYKTFCSDTCLENGRYKVKTTCIMCQDQFHVEIKYQDKTLRCFACHIVFLEKETSTLHHSDN